MLTTTEVELFRRRLSRGFFAWNVKEIMKTVSEDPKVLTNCGRTLALLKACDMDRNTVSVELIRLLIEEGSRQNFGERGGLRLPQNDHGSAPLQILVKRGSLQVLKFLSESQPPMLCKEDVSSYELLHFAASHGHVDVVKFLMSLDSDAVYSRDHHNALPIHMTINSTESCPKNRSIRELLLMHHLKRCNEKNNCSESFEWIYPDGPYTKEDILDYVQDIASIINNLDESLPILCWALSAGASRFQLLHILNLFKDAAKVRDNNNRLPIHIASDIGFGWNYGLREIFYSNPTALSVQDDVTGMYPIMLAACEKSKCDLDGVFELMKRNPESIVYHN